MRDASKRNILGVLIDAVDYEAATDFVFLAAREKRSAAISALAVHGLMTGVFNREQKFRLNHFDLLLPDGQPVRWALNLLYKAKLKDRVYGPNLTRRICERAAAEGVPVYFYGSTPEILSLLRQEIFAFEFREMLGMPTLAVGAAFPFLAGAINQAPVWMQNAGLEWLFRLVSEPNRLWRRYVYLNPAYLFLITLQALGLSRFAPDGKSPAEELLYG